MSRRQTTQPRGLNPKRREQRASDPVARWWSRKTALLSLAVGCFVALSMVAVRALSQTESQTSEPSITESQSVKPKPDAPGTIDGAKNPELIPDEVALRMVVLSVAEPPDANEEQIKRERAKLNPIGLSEEDTIALLTLLADFRAQADVIDKLAAEVYVRAPSPHPNSTDYQRLVDLGTQQSHLVTNAVAALPARLTSNGYQKLLLYLPEAKKGMKMTNETLMPK